MHVMPIQSNFKCLFANSVKCSDYAISPFLYKLAKTYPFRGRGFHSPVEWKMGYKVKNKQAIIQIFNFEYSILYIWQYKIKRNKYHEIV